MKKILITATIIAITIVIACNKNNNKPNTITSSKNAAEIISEELFNDETVYDFEINVSSSLYCPYNNLPVNLNNVIVGVQAYSMKKDNCGNFKMNNIEVPYSSSNTFFLQNNPNNLDYTNFINRNSTFSMTSNFTNFVPNFTITKFISKLATTNYSGISSDGFLSTTGNLKVTWDKELNFLENKVAVLVQGENNSTGEIKTIYKISKEEDNYIEFNNTDLINLANCTTAKIFFVRGNFEKELIDNKNISVATTHLSWTKIKLN